MTQMKVILAGLLALMLTLVLIASFALFLVCLPDFLDGIETALITLRERRNKRR